MIVGVIPRVEGGRRLFEGENEGLLKGGSHE